MTANFPKIAIFFKNTAFRILRLVGVLALIYISMIFYLALTERRNAFPRAIFHKEANNAIQGKAKGLTCTLEDGTVLNGFSLGNKNDDVFLYYPEEDEDAAQFLAQVESIPKVTLVTFNYRGSANNKGTPSQETFESDAEQIAQCAAQVNGKIPTYLAGRGTGAILASNQVRKGQQLILIDPIFSIADAIAQKYRFLYPRLLIRTKVNADINKLSDRTHNITVIYDRKQYEERTKIATKEISELKSIIRGGESLHQALLQAIKQQ